MKTLISSLVLAVLSIGNSATAQGSFVSTISKRCASLSINASLYYLDPNGGSTYSLKGAADRLSRMEPVQFDRALEKKYYLNIAEIFNNQQYSDVKYFWDEPSFFIRDASGVLHIILEYIYNVQTNSARITSSRERAKLIVSNVGMGLIQKLAESKVPEAKKAIIIVGYISRDFTNDIDTNGESIAMIFDIANARAFTSGSLSEEKFYKSMKFYLLDKGSSSAKLIELTPG